MFETNSVTPLFGLAAYDLVWFAEPDVNVNVMLFAWRTTTSCSVKREENKTLLSHTSRAHARTY